VRVHVVDPSAYTPPYDHALCGALAAAGAEVTLYTSRFAHGAVPSPDGYRRRESFYRLAARARGARTRRALKLGEHAFDMLAYRRAAAGAEIVHFQWLAVQHLDRHLLPAGRPLVLTAHDILPREPLPGQRAAQQRLYERFAAIVVHSEYGRARLTGDLGVEAERVHVIPHGAFTHLAAAPAGEQPDPYESSRGDGPVVLCFGLMRPYKGIDVLLRAWRQVQGAQLWIVGMPRMDIEPLRALAGASVRFVPRFVPDEELACYFRGADLVVLPYREVHQSGVLFTALAFGTPLLLSDAGGFPEIAATGAARTFAAGDAGALGEELLALLADPAQLAAMAAAARAAAAGEFSWEAIGTRTVSLYRRLLDARAR